jgi:hypothetical protein
MTTGSDGFRVILERDVQNTVHFGKTAVGPPGQDSQREACGGGSSCPLLPSPQTSFRITFPPAPV